MKTGTLKYCIVLFLIGHYYANAQVKNINVNFAYRGTKSIKHLNIFYDTGESIKKIDLNKLKNGKLSVTCSSKFHYLKIIILGQYKEDRFDNVENYYITKNNTTFNIIYNPDTKSNSIFLINTINDTTTDLNNFIAFNKTLKTDISHVQNMLVQYRQTESDSLMGQISTYSMKIEDKELSFIKDNSNSVVAQDLFLSKLRIYHYNRSKSELLNYFTSTFSDNIQKTYYGIVVLNKIKKLDLDLHTIAPKFTVKDIYGNNVDLESFKNNYIVINFWATWCKPCVKELPVLQSIMKDNSNKPVKYIAISSDNNLEQLTKFIAKNNLTGINIIDSDSTIGALWAIDSIPKTFVLDKKGRIIYSSAISQDPDLKILADLMNSL
nr:TlpA disulfide reductase family protein [uncultured Arsenicibacter sp.]